MVGNLTKIDWQQFKIKNAYYTKSFEDLCYHIFCRKYGLTEGVRVDFNQVGLETYPVKDPKGNLVGFQSKFFDNKLSDSSSINQIKKSLNKAKSSYPKLKKVIIYTHQAFGSDNPQYKKDIEDDVAPLEVEWFIESNFHSILFQPSNLDLAQLYFGAGAEIQFLKDSLSTDIITFLSSSYYIPLPVQNSLGKKVSKVREYILRSGCRVHLLIGNPGSGKSVSMYKLFHELAGLNKNSIGQMRKQLIRQDAIPIIINLRDCITDSIENIIRGRQNDYRVKHRTLKFIYLFDGLDELSEHRVEPTLSYISDLLHKSDTNRIVFSCRSGSLNRLKSKSFFENIDELSIAPLDQIHVDQYFDAKSDALKKAKLKLLRKRNPDLISEIHDILLLNLLWDTIGTLNASSKVIDLIEMKVKLLVKSSKHKKYLEELNLLDPKEEKILSLQEDISYEFHKEYQFRFSLDQLQQLIIKTYNFNDNISVNRLINYLRDLFFENSYTDSRSAESFIYQHRRYQEYFFAKKLRSKYEKDPTVLRELNVISNIDFFEDLFLSSLRRDYIRENNLVGLVDLNLIDVYLGKNNGWGADNAYYLESKEFIVSLMSQNDLVFEKLINDENLKVKDKIFKGIININHLKEILANFFKTGDNEDEQHLRYVWENSLSRLIDLQAELHRNRKIAFAKDVGHTIKNIYKAFKDYDFETYSREKSNYGYLLSPIWASFESYLYNIIVIEENELELVYQNRILANYESFQEEVPFSIEEVGKEKLIKSFLRVSIAYKLKDLINLIDQFDSYELASLLEILSDATFLSIVYNNPDLREKIKASILRIFSESSDNLSVLFFKHIFGITIEQKEVQQAESRWREFQEQHPSALQRRAQVKDAVLASHLTNKHSFARLFEKYDKDFNYYNELSLYTCLFFDYIELLKGEKDIGAIIRDFNKYQNLYTRHNSEPKYFIDEISKLWVYIFANSKADIDIKKQLKRLLFQHRKNLSLFTFNLTLRKNYIPLSSDLIFKTDLEDHEKDLVQNKYDFPRYIDHCLDLSILYSKIDEGKALRYIAKGINDGIIRHGWRKDPLVCDNLVDSLDILWKNEWPSKKELTKYSKEIFELTTRVADITDGKVTWRGPYNLIEVVSKYNLPLALKFEKKLKLTDSRYSIILTTSIIKGKINAGYPFEDITSDIESYKKYYDHEGRTRREYHVERVKVYLELASSLLYSEEERRQSFDKAFAEINVMLSYGEKYGSWWEDLRYIKDVYEDLCNKYSVKSNIPVRNQEDQTDEKYDENEEAKLIENLLNINTKSSLARWYSNLMKSDPIQVKKMSSWQAIIDTTSEIDGNISRFLAVMKKSYFPHSDYFSSNSKFYYLGLAAALGNINTKQETLEYLYKESGHAGFLHLIKSFAVLRDERMCLALFQRFLKLSNFLVN